MTLQTCVLTVELCAEQRRTASRAFSEHSMAKPD